MNKEKSLTNHFASLAEDSFARVTNVKTQQELTLLKSEYLKGAMSLLNRSLKELSEVRETQLKKDFGRIVNDWKRNFSEVLTNKKIELERIDSSQENIFDKQWEFSLESKKRKIASPHPISKTIKEIKNFFFSRGYQLCKSPEIEKVSYNFDKLNVNKDHPARDRKDTFYINQELLLRTHTSSVQPRILELNSNQQIKAFCFGKVYRRDDDDATHSFQYTNLEIVVVGKKVNILHLKGTIEEFLREIFNEELKIRFRNSFFPFTEPSFEVDCSCFVCWGNDCRCAVCKGEGWIEILGAGMIHRKILKESGYQNSFSGFAAGIGVERIIMIANSIKDIRNFYTNDLRFLKQGKK